MKPEPRTRLMASGLLVLVLCFLAPLAAAQDAPKDLGSLQQDLVFADYSPLSANAELLRRLLSPLTVAQIQRSLARSGKALAGQEIKLPEERFVLYVPAHAPPQGYALLVYLPPWPEARLPQGWAEVLDQYGMIFVSAARTGNEASLLGRRAPLALIAVQNVMRRYTVNPQRVYIGGFSGGARAALRLALSFPDVFHGAVLNAGSDPIGDAQAPLPPRDLFLQFQNTTRLVYVSGEEDVSHLSMDADSADSMRQWCVYDFETQTIYRAGKQTAGHESADPAALSRALDSLLKPVTPDADKLAACRAAIEKELTEKLQRVESLIAGGKRDEAQKLLREIDARFGGLAAPRSVELAQNLSN
jgi:hypothetical protein